MKNILFLGLLGIIVYSTAYPCTTAIVSGRCTVDGRPILLKHRDSDYMQNRLIYFHDGQYDYIGLVNSSDTAGAEVWAGCNSAGFAIMNSADYNLNTNDTTQIKDGEGYLMKKALQSCASVTEFEQFLQQLPKPLGVEANFGVIDANGGAAYFETGNFTYTKFDANDQRVAPFGYLIRTNYAFTGTRDNDFGLIRYRTADELFYIAANTHSLSYDFILRDVSRCLKHSLIKTDLTCNLPPNSSREHFVWFQDYIPRFSSTSSVVITGVKPGESPTLMTMWTILGFPLTSVAIPVWVAGGDKLPSVLTADASGNAPLCSMALALKKQCFPIERESGKSYLNLAAVMNEAHDGILQKLRPIEEDIIRAGTNRIDRWRIQGKAGNDIDAFYRWIDDMIPKEYKKLFGKEILTN